jgi:hypothetical protein
VQNIIGGMDLGPLLGVTITPVRAQVQGLNRIGGTLIAARQDGEIVYMNKIISAMRMLDDDELVFSTPADIKIHPLPNGQNILYVPEEEPNANQEWKQRLRVILLPSGL